MRRRVYAHCRGVANRGERMGGGQSSDIKMTYTSSEALGKLEVFVYLHSVNLGGCHT